MSALVQVAGLLLLVGAQDLAGFAVAFGLVGVGRALDSGPLEAWYVEVVQAGNAKVDVTRGLSLAGVADGLALAVGSVVGGVLPSLMTGADDSALAAPLLVAAVLDLGYLVCVLRYVTQLDGPSSASPLGALVSGAREIPQVVRASVATARRDAALRLLFGVAFCLGGVFYTLEVLGPLHFADLAGDATEGSAVFGVVLALTFVASAAGSALAGTARRAARGSARAAIAVLFAAGAALLLLLAASGSVVLAAVAFGAFYLTNSATGPLRRQLLHSRITSSVRATTLSSLSLCLQAGGIAAGLSIPFLAQRSGRPAAFVAVAVAGVVLVTALLALRLPATSPEPHGTA